MSERVASDEIEQIVGVARDQTRHMARAVSVERKVYILHSQDCLGSVSDLRDCPYSLALDNGIDPDCWVEDFPLHVVIEDGELLPSIGPE